MIVVVVIVVVMKVVVVIIVVVIVAVVIVAAVIVAVVIVARCGAQWGSAEKPPMSPRSPRILAVARVRGQAARYKCL